MSFRFLIYILVLIAIPVLGLLLLSKPIAMHFAGQAHVSQKWGDDDAPVKIIHFVDYLNPASHRIYGQLVQVKGQDGDVQIISRELPVSEESKELAKMALALRDVDLYQSIQNKFMFIPVDTLPDYALSAVGTLNIDAQKFEEKRTSEDLDKTLLWNQALAYLFGVPKPPLLVINGRVIDHDGFTASDIKGIVNSYKK